MRVLCLIDPTFVMLAARGSSRHQSFIQATWVVPSPRYLPTFLLPWYLYIGGGFTGLKGVLAYTP